MLQSAAESTEKLVAPADAGIQYIWGGVRKLHFDSQCPQPPWAAGVRCRWCAHSPPFEGGTVLPDNQIMCSELACCLLLPRLLLLTFHWSFYPLPSIPAWSAMTTIWCLQAPAQYKECKHAHDFRAMKSTSLVAPPHVIMTRLAQSLKRGRGEQGKPCACR